MKFKRLLAAKGIHYLITRFGSARLRSLAFDQKYQRGDWDFHGDGEEMPAVVTKYMRKGNLLMMGCGSASLVNSLESETFSDILGVDLSAEAIRRARQTNRNNISFEVGDMVKFRCAKSYNVILFSESLYYVPAMQQVDMLRRYSAQLKDGGVIIVTFAQAERYQEIIERIRENFTVVEDRTFVGSTRHLIVFNSVTDPNFATN